MSPIGVRTLAATILMALCALPVAAQNGDATTVYPVYNHGRLAGHMTVARDADQTVVRYEYRDRNRGRWVEMRYRLSGDGWPIAVETLPVDNETGETGDRQAWFEADADSVRWSAGDETRAEALDPGAIYQPPGGNPFHEALVARFLLERPDHRGRILPGGDVRLDIVGDAVVTTDRGPERVRLAVVGREGDNSPSAVWIDDEGELFATGAGWFITVRPGAEHTLPTLRSIEAGYRNAVAAHIAADLMPDLDGAVVVANGNVFDAEAGVILPSTTIVVEGDRIAAVGPAGSIDVPDDATVIDATDRTVIPGMWEMHGHHNHSSQVAGSLRKLAAGITTVRDLAADVDAAVSQRDRADAGTIVSPRLVLAGFIEGPGAWAGPTSAIAATVEEAREWIARYDSLGYVQIKLYNLIHPDIVPAIAEEADRRGMLLSGHIPRGLSVEAAVELGYDEIQHAAFLFSTHFQDSLYVPEMRPYSGVASIVAPDFDVDGPEMTRLIDFLAERGTMIDGTFNIWEGPQTLTGDLRPQSAAYRRLLARLYEAGVPLVAGTDNGNGLPFHMELALYEDAGIPAPKVLQIATIDAARFMGQDADYGSIAVGKVADLAIIDGDPAERVLDLWFVEDVIRAGVPYRTEDLRRVSGWEAPGWWTDHIREVTGREP
ncbi:MAG: amidohydrolase family protein [Gemmatimonadota bacterium]|nr:amidohydrolase family protein [Gemmatimonadota bacterium]